MGAGWSLWDLFGPRPRMPARPPARRDEGDEQGVLELRLGGHEEEDCDEAESVVLLTDEELEAEEWGPPEAAAGRS